MTTQLNLVHSDSTNQAPFDIRAEIKKTTKTPLLILNALPHYTTLGISKINLAKTLGKIGVFGISMSLEVFWQNRTEISDHSAPYHEWQISPNNKKFCLDIYTPRVCYATPLSCPIIFHSDLNQRQWNASLTVPKSVYQDYKYVYLGLFAILGHPQKRSYYGLNLTPTTTPNFHLPEFFYPSQSLHSRINIKLNVK